MYRLQADGHRSSFAIGRDHTRHVDGPLEAPDLGLGIQYPLEQFEVLFSWSTRPGFCLAPLDLPNHTFAANEIVTVHRP